jgi:hypothetical protein
MIDIDDIDDLAEEAMEDNKGRLAREQMSKIDPRLHTYYNSVNILCGRQGQGKTYTAIKEIAKITHANLRTCLVVYITKEVTATDDTMESLKHLIRCPVLYVAETDAERCVQDLHKAMDFYKDVKDHHAENRILPQDKNHLFKTLRIRNFSQPFLHIVILFDDFANSSLIRKPESYFSRFIATLRHRGFSVFICIQFWRSMSPQLKSNAAVIYVFSGYSPQQFYSIIYQAPTKRTSREIYYGIYAHLKQNDKLVVDAISGETYVNDAISGESYLI